MVDDPGPAACSGPHRPQQVLHHPRLPTVGTDGLFHHTWRDSATENLQMLGAGLLRRWFLSDSSNRDAGQPEARGSGDRLIRKRPLGRRPQQTGSLRRVHQLNSPLRPSARAPEPLASGPAAIDPRWRQRRCEQPSAAGCAFQPPPETWVRRRAPEPFSDCAAAGLHHHPRVTD